MIDPFMDRRRLKELVNDDSGQDSQEGSWRLKKETYVDGEDNWVCFPDSSVQGGSSEMLGARTYFIDGIPFRAFTTTEQSTCSDSP